MLRSSSPWGVTALYRLIATNVVAAGLLGGGWWLLSGAHDPVDQLPWLNLSIAGLLVALWGNTRWLMEGRRRVGTALHEQLAIQDADESTVDPTEPAHCPTGGHVVVGPGLVRFHRPDCAMAEGRGWPRVDRAQVVDEDRLPCGVCAP